MENTVTPVVLKRDEKRDSDIFRFKNNLLCIAYTTLLIMCQVSQENNKARLILSDGSKWQLNDHCPDIALVDELACVMGLEPNKTQILPHGEFNMMSKDVKKNIARFKGFVEFFLPIYKQSIARGGLLVHSALLEYQGQGVLLVAHSGTGKTTCCNRLPARWLPLCDDEVLVVRDKKNNYQAHPFPTWSDVLWTRTEKSWDVQHSAPLSAIFFLKQSVSDRLETLGQGKTAVLLHDSTQQICHKFSYILDSKEQKEFSEQLFQNSCDLAKQIPAYRLHIALNGKFWTKIKQVLKQDVYS